MMANTTHTAVSRRLLLALLLAAAASWLHSSPASAHAAYESSSPAFAEVLDEPPTEIAIRFTQELFRRAGANQIELREFSGDAGAEYEVSAAVVANADRHTMRVAILSDLGPGRYLVTWTNLSAEDGDEDSGSYPFYIQRGPEPAEIEVDRGLAEELLVRYPGDEEDDPQADVATAAPTPAVVRAEERDDVALGAGPIAWLAAGGVAALLLAGGLGFHFGSRKRQP